MRAILLVLGMTVVAGCMTTTSPIPGPSPYEDPTTIWRTVRVNGEAYQGDAFITFPSSGEISGKDGCNNFFGRLTAPWPEFATASIQSTMVECTATPPGFWPAFDAATSASISGNTLSLSNGSTVVMVLRAAS